MLKTVLKRFVGLGVLIATLACAGVAPAIPTLDPYVMDTAIAGTMAAAATQTAQSVVQTVGPTSTVTLTRTLSPTPFPTYTLVIALPIVYVSKSTHCRAGPGKGYASLGALKAGEAVQVVGRSRDANYWIIRNPRRPSQFCWLSGKYASVSGVAGALPVFTNPPPPTATRTRKPPTRTPKPRATATAKTPGTPATAPGTPDFTAAYGITINCTGSAWYVQIDLQNTGTATFQSIGMIVDDPVAPFTDSLVSDDFINNNGCSKDTVDTLPPGASNKVSLPPLTYDPTGHALDVGISLCTKPALGGSCVGKIINFTP